MKRKHRDTFELTPYSDRLSDESSFDNWGLKEWLLNGPLLLFAAIGQGIEAIWKYLLPPQPAQTPEALVVREQLTVLLTISVSLSIIGTVSVGGPLWLWRRFRHHSQLQPRKVK